VRVATFHEVEMRRGSGPSGSSESLFTFAPVGVWFSGRLDMPWGVLTYCRFGTAFETHKPTAEWRGFHTVVRFRCPFLCYL
jgi:hypothetical protein